MMRQLANAAVTVAALGFVAFCLLASAGCAGLPVGHGTHVFVGVGVVRVDKAERATGVSSWSLGAAIQCQILTIGAQASYCAHLPLEGDVAIIERGSGPNQHLTDLRPKETP